MHVRFSKFLGIMTVAALVSCNNESDKSTASTAIDPAASLNNLIPKPVAATAASGVFSLSDSTLVTVAPGNPDLNRIAGYLASALRPATGFSLKVDSTPGAGNAIALALVNDSSLSSEGYEMKITPGGITINAYKPAGAFYAVQTLRQLLPPAIESKTVQNGPWQIAAATIRDYPDYAMRGAMLDVARHFFGVEDVKRFIDFLAFYKMNTFHWHLSDDQGWRIEIKKWPRLAEYGGSIQVGGGKGGFYTQEEYKEVVQYAADRFITVIPEIDMPGHTNAALAAYPEFNCNEKIKIPSYIQVPK